ncbi:MAG: RNA methyltransferase [Candidatus Omnitrophota bacterium]|nr:RNA methyltransferase [Candidatus Omnitrophota bacterium]
MRLYGKNPVIERIKADPGSIIKLYLRERTDLSDVVREARNAGLEFESAAKTRFREMCGAVHTQGVMAEIKEFKYTPFSKILAECLDKISVPVFLDGVTDPQNLGSIIRNLACLGGFTLVLPEHRSAQVNETVLRVASGGENYLGIARTVNIATTVKKAKAEGVLIAGAFVEDSDDILKTELRLPLAVVIGSEGKGIRPGIRKCLDVSVSLPMPGAPLSYNVAVAASLFCYEINRRRWAMDAA